MYPSSFFRFKKLVDQREIENNTNDTLSVNQNINTANNVYNDYDGASIKNNMDEFISLFKTQEKACYELRSENTVLKFKLEAANEIIRNQSKKIQSVKMKKNKLQIENNVYKNVLCGSLNNNNNNYNNSNNYNNNNNNNSPNKCIKNEEHHSSNTHLYPPPPPPPLPLPPSTKLKVNGNFQMNSVLDELKSKIKKID
jgi:hypothetical protein